jgi:hypothetical protein
MRTIYDMTALAMAHPIGEAAKILGLGTTRLKAECRRMNMLQWPYRAIQATRKMLCSPSISLQDKARIEDLMRTFMTDPLHTDLAPCWILDLRAKVYKATYGRRFRMQRTKPWYLSIDVSGCEFDVPFFCPHSADMPI